MGKFLAGTTFGFFFFLTVTTIYNSSFIEPKHKVGTCLSNGLFYEKVIEIRKPSRFGKKLYVLDSYINGKLSAPSTNDINYVDENYIIINPVNCQVK